MTRRPHHCWAAPIHRDRKSGGCPISPSPLPTHTDQVLKRIALSVGVVVGILTLGGWAYASYMDRQMDATPLTERLDATPVPPEFIFVDEWSHDGSWLIKPREPTAAKQYVTRGSVQEACSTIDGFYRELGSEVSGVSRSDDPDDWCGRRIRSNGGTVDVSVKPARSWIELPEAPPGTEFAEVLFQAHR